ncbi:PREDICTED: uncharacterized protein LOC100634973 isoform X2 [Amphimedon queenslandica]|uniref:SANT and BTB domain-containing protein n=1 Tax=Amphimedon queenslandica TaxID=400682 RepID=A0A1X7VHS1_AMPQE|nr:PREDICTED: uncharacterized protein LOC100634973 isoform X2 [Amphimedon queenslandica]|eukprot:XP_019848808.1 PREDICTED: uncharacterized protein LOC100634973 isoform X2 [Amphimedon queenslandica]
MAYSSASTSVPSSSRGSGGAAHRAVALDLMLRTFMNSPEFQPYNPRMWEGISKLVPGTTPHQCIQRWEELRSASKFITRDFSVLAAKGRPFTSSSYNTSHSTHYKKDPAFTSSVTELPPITNPAAISSSSSRPPSSTAAYHYEQYRGSLTNESYSRLSAGRGRLAGSFCQNYLYKREKEYKRESQGRVKDNGGGVERQYSRQSLSSVSENAIRESTNNKIKSLDTFEHAQLKKTTDTDTTTTSSTTTANNNNDNANNNTNSNTSNGNTAEHIEDNSSKGNVQNPDKDTGDDDTAMRSSAHTTPTKDYVKKETIAGTNGASKEGEGEGPSINDVSPAGMNQLVIHVKDEAKKKSRDFLCSRELLISEMKYFKEYFLTNLPADMSREWEEIDISVHCDIGVFHWLMTYVKRGMNEGPTGEKRDKPLEPPELSPANAVSILISSDFLRMEELVEKCLDYCHHNMTDILASPANIGCIGGDLVHRLADRFSPLEAEAIIDEKDKIKSKIYLCLLEKLFDPTYRHSECPQNASTLYKCKICGRFLTQAQQSIFKCTSSRLTVNKRGQLVHEHERDATWSIDKYLMSLRDKRMTWREIFWKLWGKVNWLSCSQCGDPFQCSSLSTCLYHPKQVVQVDSDGSKLPPGTGRYFCCGQTIGKFTSLPAAKGGCQYRNHTHQSDISAILIKLKDIICERVGLPESTGERDNGHFNMSFSNIIIKETLPIKVLNIDLTSNKKATPKQKTSPSVDTNNKTKQTNNNTTNNNTTNNTTQTNTTATSSITLDNKGKGRHGRAMGTTVGTMVGRTGVGKEQSGGDNGQLVETAKRGEGGMTARRDCIVTEEDGTGSERDTTCTGNSSMACTDIEEDEEDMKKVTVVVEKPPQPLKKTIKKIKNCSTKGKTEKILSDMDWIWDNTKSVRWNQDMQRFQDELRISQLQGHLRKLKLSTCKKKVPPRPPPKIKQRSISSDFGSHSSTGTGRNNGGIYAQLEGQFFANLARSQKLSKSKRQKFK